MKMISVHQNRSVKAYVDVQLKLQHFCSQRWIVSAQFHAPAALSPGNLRWAIDCRGGCRFDLLKVAKRKILTLPGIER
jgi:hypothetical protein